VKDLERAVLAVKGGERAVLEGLLDSDAALAEASVEGVSLVLLALYHRRPELAELIAGRRHGLEVHELAALGRAEGLRALVARAPDEAQRSTVDGWTPLALAAFFGHEEAVRVLLDAGADPRAASRNAARATPLHGALACASLPVARLLLDRGADAGAREAGGVTPLHEAAARGHRALAELLLERGADPSARDDEGRTAADLARHRGHRDLAEWLSALLPG